MKKTTNILTAFATAVALILGASAFVSCSNSSDDSSSSTPAMSVADMTKFINDKADEFGKYKEVSEDGVKKIDGQDKYTLSDEAQAYNQLLAEDSEIKEGLENWKFLKDLKDNGADKCEVCKAKANDGEADAQSEENCTCIWLCADNDACDAENSSKDDMIGSIYDFAVECWKTFESAFNALSPAEKQVALPDEGGEKPGTTPENQTGGTGDEE